MAHGKQDAYPTVQISQSSKPKFQRGGSLRQNQIVILLIVGSH